MPKSSFTAAGDRFRDLLKQERLSKGLTQRALADRLGLPQSYVSKYETGERRLDFVETAIVCKALGIDLAEFAATFSAQLRVPKTKANVHGR